MLHSSHSSDDPCSLKTSSLHKSSKSNLPYFSYSKTLICSHLKLISIGFEYILITARYLEHLYVKWRASSDGSKHNWKYKILSNLIKTSTFLSCKITHKIKKIEKTTIYTVAYTNKSKLYGQCVSEKKKNNTKAWQNDCYCVSNKEYKTKGTRREWGYTNRNNITNHIIVRHPIIAALLYKSRVELSRE